jgi:plasmid stabilization system protein ParE
VTYQFHPAARAELLAAARWYEARRQGLGRQFLAESRRTVEASLLTPDAFPTLSRRTRRCRLRRFPYAIVYRREEEAIVIYAVMHLRRRPGYWAERTK